MSQRLSWDDRSIGRPSIERRSSRADPRAFAEMKARDQVVFRYVSADGTQGGAANPNGSLDDVAGICNVEGNVVGLMPHPERASDPLLGGTDGARLFKSLATTRLAMQVP